MAEIPSRDVPFRAGGFAPRIIPFAGAATLVLLLALCLCRVWFLLLQPWGPPRPLSNPTAPPPSRPLPLTHTHTHTHTHLLATLLQLLL